MWPTFEQACTDKTTLQDQKYPMKPVHKSITVTLWQRYLKAGYIARLTWDCMYLKQTCVMNECPTNVACEWAVVCCAVGDGRWRRRKDGVAAIEGKLAWPLVSPQCRVRDWRRKETPSLHWLTPVPLLLWIIRCSWYMLQASVCPVAWCARFKGGQHSCCWQVPLPKMNIPLHDDLYLLTQSQHVHGQT